MLLAVFWFASCIGVAYVGLFRADEHQRWMVRVSGKYRILSWPYPASFWEGYFRSRYYYLLCKVVGCCGTAMAAIGAVALLLASVRDRLNDP